MSAQDIIDTDDGTLPAGLRVFMRKRTYEVSGLLILSCLAMVAVALATWSVDDPSLNHATSAAPQNFLGLPGAVLADELMQLFGLSVLGFMTVPVAWAAKLLAHHRPENMKASILCWLLSGPMLATALSALPSPSTWPLSVGLGGIAGDNLAYAFSSLFALALKGAFSWIATVSIAGAAFVWLALKAMGITRIEAGSRIETASGFLGSGLALLWHGLCTVARWRPSVPGFLKRPDFLKRKETSLPRVRRSASSEPEGDIIERLAPTRSGAAKAVRIEPALDGAARRGPTIALGGVEVGPADDDGEESEDGDEEVEEVVAEKRAMKKPARRTAKSVGEFELPPLDLLSEPKRLVKQNDMSPETLADNATALEGVLDDFGVKGQIINVRPGPVVTLYELEPAPGIKSSRVISLADDIARSMSAVSARVAVVPGRNAIGIELPNLKRETVYLRELMGSELFTESKMALAFALGKNIGGEPILADLARMPHLLIAGTTGSGKSVGINTMILSLLYRMPPDRCKLIMIDPKMLELSVYEGIPHLLAPVVTDPRKAVVALKWAVREMEDRYKKMSKVGVRNVDGYNQRIAQLLAKGEKLTRTVQTGFDPQSGEPIFEKEEMETSHMPFIVVIIDEMADLMMVAGKDIEGAVQRLAQMARAAGIHVVMATQRPSVDVITGTIKANFPTRISFQVTSKIDSRTILGEQGAEQLLGQGDMLYMAGGGRISRLHGAFVSDSEVEAIVTHLKSQATPEYVDAVTEEADEPEFGDGPDGEVAGGGSGDDLYDQAVAVVLRDKKVSTSYVQRRLQIGYNKAASLIERMEQEGLISASNATGKREILVPGDSARA